MSAVSSILIGLGSGSIGTLLTIFLTPKLQFRIWLDQRRFELRLENVKELERLTSELFNYLSWNWSGELKPEDELKDHIDFQKTFAEVWIATIHRSYYLFPRIKQVLHELHDAVRLTFHEDVQWKNFDRFLKVREKAFEALFTELNLKS